MAIITNNGQLYKICGQMVLIFLSLEFIYFSSILCEENDPGSN